MKVRWTRTSLRLRITPAELEAIVQGEPVGETLPMAGWSVRVVRAPGTTELTMVSGSVALALSPSDAQLLAEPDREGVYFDRGIGEPVRYFIEKDFPCVHPKAMEALEAPTETFPEPVGFRERKQPV